MSKFSNTNELNDMIDKFVYKYETIFRDVIRSPNMFEIILKNDIQKIVDEAKKEARNANDKSGLSDDFKSSLDDFLFQPTNGFLR